MSSVLQQQSWCVFPVTQGFCGVAWSVSGVTLFLLPEQTPERMCDELRSVTGQLLPASKIPAWIRQLARQVVLHLKGQRQDFSATPVVVANATPFMQSVYDEARRIPAGSVISYAELAARIHKPGAVRAVGTALGKNPVPLIIPCHRIIAASGKLGGFSAQGGLDAKTALLHCEGVSLEKPQGMITAAQWRAGVAHLQKDKNFQRLQRQTGHVMFRPQRNADPLEAFVDAIVSQQLSTKVAAVILTRVNKLIHRNGRPCAKKILAAADEDLRGAGLSGMKVSYLKDLARHSIDGKLPSLSAVDGMSDEQIIRCFSAVKGIGRWSVEMYLIFDLGRADVFPVDDYGIRKAIAQLHGLAELQPAKAMAQYAEKWRPYRSIASLYLWRSLNNK